MNQVIIADTGFWIALLDNRDQYHADALSVAEYLPDYKIIFPWPCIFETLSTRFIRDRRRVAQLEKILIKPGVIRENDEKYRENALQMLFDSSRLAGTTFSLVDVIIRQMIKDRNLRIRYMLTFNKKDFQDLINERFELI